MKFKSILVVCTALLLLTYNLYAHNGAMAIAIPVDGIVVDGDLSDWPDDMSEYPIDFRMKGKRNKGINDARRVFQIGYNEPENALYIAAETQYEICYAGNLS
jgi:hypothetical protein